MRRLHIRKVVKAPTTLVLIEDEEGDLVGEIPVVNARTPMEAAHTAAAFVEEGFFDPERDLLEALIYGADKPRLLAV